MDIGFFAAHEQYSPAELLSYVERAERIGFDTAWTSDHLHPWWDSGASCGAAWPWLGAALGRTDAMRIGTGVTPPLGRYHPGLIAQVFATLQAMFPGRVFCTLATGEAMNERPLGFDWPGYPVRRERLIEACEIIRKLWTGGFHDYDGDHWELDTMKLYTLPAEPPSLYVAANGPKSAYVAGRYADGFLTTIDDLDRYEDVLLPALADGAADGDRDPDEIRRIKHLGLSFATEYERALDGVENWLGPMVLGHSEDIWDPREIEAKSADVPRDEWDDWGLVTTEPDDIKDALRRYRNAGFDEVEILSASPDQSAFLGAMDGILTDWQRE